MYYYMYKDVQGFWRWRLNSANNQVIASGEGYVNKGDCERAIQLVKGSSVAPVYSA